MAIEQTNAPAKSAGGRAIAGWVLFDWATQPFYTLVLTFLFAPYFANVFIGDAVRGQALWGYGAAAIGVIVAIGSPILGAMADAIGRRKVWIAGFSIVLIVASSLLWQAEPGAPDKIVLVLAAFVAAGVAAEFATVFTNAMMPGLVPPDRIGRLSGLGWAIGYLGGMVSLLLLAGLLVADPASGKTMLGLTPIIDFDQSQHQGDRFVGPFVAGWYALFVLPLLLFTPDHQTSKPTGRISDGFRQLAATVREARQYSNILFFLAGRMLYADGLAAIFAFGGIYGASTFDWGVLELGLFGVALTLVGAVGALIGGRLDDAIGARRLILAALVILLTATTGILSVTRDTTLFGYFNPTTGLGAIGPFTTPQEHVYLGFALVIGLVAGPLQSASRSLLARLSPPDKQTQFFGLFAFSGKVTSFMAPFLIATVTTITSSQRVGISMVGIFLVGGFLLMLRVRD